jgi:hypothetical protein
MFILGKISVTRELRNYLRAYGIFIFKNGKRIAENLVNIITASEYHEWTEAKINEKLKISKTFYSQWNPITDEYKAFTFKYIPL